MTDVNGAPLVSALFEEEAKAAIAFGVDLAPIKFETLCDCRFHFGDCAIALNICRASVNTMHNEGPSIHPVLGRLNELFYGCSSCPSRIHVGPFMENGFEILPFARIAIC